MKSTVLIARDVNDHIAYTRRPLKRFKDSSGASFSRESNPVVITAGEFVKHVTILASRLPDKRHCINLCDNRYLFMVSVCAVIVARQTNLLPANKSLATQSRLAEDYPQTYLIHDGLVEIAADVESFDLDQAIFPCVGDIQESIAPSKIPEIRLDHLAVISFTSGSTGESQANLKTWNTLLSSTAINSEYMLPNQHQTFHHLATMPSQHMWGFETTVLLAMFANVCISDSRPLYPRDIYQELSRLPEPRGLISTPLHLRALNGSRAKAPAIDYILSATAPLDRSLASAIETTLSTKIREVYGCSEVGSMSIRETTKSRKWELFHGLNFDIMGEDKVVASANHLPKEIVLQDRIKLLGGRYFELKGRASDLVNIAGKRGSLLEVNAVMAAFPGLLDGVVFFPPQKKSVPRLVAMVVLEPEIKLEELRQYLKNQLDMAFVPRPIFLVEALPREETGKLTQRKLIDFYQSMQASS